MSKSEKYEIEAEDLLKECYRLAFEETNWISKYDKEDIQLYSTPTPYCLKCPCYKLETYINMSPERIFDTVNPFGPYRIQYDSNILDVQLLEEISDNCCIIYKKFQPKIFGFGLRQADGVDLALFDKTDEFYYALHKHVEYKGHDECFGIRAISHPTGMLIFPTEDPNVSRLTLLWHVDINAPRIVPGIIIDKISCSSLIKHVTSLESMKDEPYERLTSDVPFCRKRII
jgi:hypothetical protein